MSRQNRGPEGRARRRTPASFRAFSLIAFCVVVGGGRAWAFQATAPQTPAAKAQDSSGKTTGSGKGSGVKHSSHSKKSAGSKASGKAGSRRARTRRQLAPTPERISEIQSALAKAGNYSGEPTGKWDAASMQAMKDFQAKNGLPATGKLEARSLQKLGLGSPIAGVAPPRPPATTPSEPAKQPPASKPPGALD